MKLMSLTLIAVANRGSVIELTYEETVRDPHPFVLTVTSQHISRQTSKLPIEASDLEAYVLSHATELLGQQRGANPRALLPRSCSSGAGPELRKPIRRQPRIAVDHALKVYSNATMGAWQIFCC